MHLAHIMKNWCNELLRFFVSQWLVSLKVRTLVCGCSQQLAVQLLTTLVTG